MTGVQTCALPICQHLDSDLRETFEQRLGGDFSDVRIHTGPAAAQAAEAIDAKAFTCGTDIVFNSGEYDPESPRGQFLLTHELAHVSQQTEGAISMLPGEDADVALEKGQGSTPRTVTGRPVRSNQQTTPTESSKGRLFPHIW